jgi:glycosyltransferase involved in cell wall biosynthesis
MNETSPLKLSVIIPTCHRDDLLARCLESLEPAKQGVAPGIYEVVVTDDGSKATAEQMIRKHFPWVRWVAGPGRGPASNRNCGAKAARAEWIAFIDDDCVASPVWISRLLSVMATGDFDVIEGMTIIPDRIDNPFYHGVQNVAGGSYWSCNLAFLRQRFWAIGGFDEEFPLAVAEDMELAHRFTRAKFRAKFSPEALVYHPMRPGTFLYTCRRVFLVKWYVLYQYKTGVGLEGSRSRMSNVIGGIRGETHNILRRTWRELREFDFKYWRCSSFGLLFRLVTAPLVIPLFAIWTYRYYPTFSAKGAAVPA